MNEKKVNNIFKLMELFVQNKTICKNGNILSQQGMIIEQIEDLGFNIRNIRRYLTEIEKKYSHIVKIKKSGSDCYKLESISQIFYAFLQNSEDISYLIPLMYESDKNLLNECAKETRERLERISKDEKDIFLFQQLPFDELATSKRKDIFNRLKFAIKNNEYRDIYYYYNNQKIIKNAKCLKLLFLDSNWYIATESKEKGFLLLRMAFITHVEYPKKRSSYQPSQIKKYFEYFKNIQNPMTRYGVKKQKAHFLASPKVAKYFKPHMKKNLNSQTFIEEREDGSIEFTLEYTHSLEVLPFIKRFLPDILVLSPTSLQKTMTDDLNQYLAFKGGSFSL